MPNLHRSTRIHLAAMVLGAAAVVLGGGDRSVIGDAGAASQRRPAAAPTSYAQHVPCRDQRLGNKTEDANLRASRPRQLSAASSSRVRSVAMQYQAAKKREKRGPTLASLAAGLQADERRVVGGRGTPLRGAHDLPELLFYAFLVKPGSHWYDLMLINKLCYFQRHNYTLLLEVLELEPSFTRQFGDQHGVAVVNPAFKLHHGTGNTHAIPNVAPRRACTLGSCSARRLRPGSLLSQRP